MADGYGLSPGNAGSWRRYFPTLTGSTDASEQMLTDWFWGTPTSITGTAAAADEHDTAAATGNPIISGAGASTDDPDTCTATGSTSTPPTPPPARGGGRAKPYRIPRPPSPPRWTPVTGAAACKDTDDVAAAWGTIDPLWQRRQDEDLLLLVGAI